MPLRLCPWPAKGKADSFLRTGKALHLAARRGQLEAELLRDSSTKESKMVQGSAAADGPRPTAKSAEMRRDSQIVTA